MNEQINKFLQERIDDGDFPSAVYLVAEKGEIVLHDALGHAVVEPERIPAGVDTIYDLASLTKVLVTGLVAAKLSEAGRFALGESVSSYLPQFDTDDKRAITIKNLLVHDSGLSGWLPMYLLADRAENIVAAIAERPLEYAMTKAVVYSDPNFIAVGKVIEKICGESIDEIARKTIIEPLAIRVTVYTPPKSLKIRIAASEKGNEFELQLCVEKGYVQPPATACGSDSDSAFRTEMIWGEVHDHNTYFMGGVGGHAGLFSTAEEVFKIAQQFLPSYTQLLKPETCELFRTNFTPGMNEDRSFAFQLASTKDSTAGTKMSPQSFGHNGFTGTSLWIDPVKERIFILLTNRTHNHALPFANINSVRRKFHDMAIDLLNER